LEIEGLDKRWQTGKLKQHETVRKDRKLNQCFVTSTVKTLTLSGENSRNGELVKAWT
ncbi:hypothetical protein BgiMline_027422, partial [Biomphalaria glabrata]